jgi:broad specificity phosphatase PhoE
MTEIVLVRHGQASFGAEDYDKLSPLGHQQAEWLGGYFSTHGLEFDRVLRGALRRHRETAEGIARAHELPEVVEDERFDEFHYFGLERDYIAATGADAPSDRDTFLSIFPEVFIRWERGEIDGGTETFAAFSARVNEALNDAVEAGGRTLIVTSGGVIGVALGRVLGLSPQATADVLLNIHNASVHRLEWEAGKLRLSLFNASPHLDPIDRVHARTYV